MAQNGNRMEGIMGYASMGTYEIPTPPRIAFDDLK